jgi:hypothetical protein
MHESELRKATDQLARLIADSCSHLGRITGKMLRYLIG